MPYALRLDSALPLNIELIENNDIAAKSRSYRVFTCKPSNFRIF